MSLEISYHNNLAVVDFVSTRRQVQSLDQQEVLENNPYQRQARRLNGIPGPRTVGPNFGDLRQVIETMVELRTPEPPDALATDVALDRDFHRSELRTMKTNFSKKEWKLAKRIAKRRLIKIIAEEEKQSA